MPLSLSLSLTHTHTHTHSHSHSYVYVKSCNLVWTLYFSRCVPTRLAQTHFRLKWKTNFFYKKFRVTTYFYLFLKGKTSKNKTSKRTPDFFGKAICEKTWVWVWGSGYLSRRYLQKGSTPLSPNNVSTSLVEGNMTINQLIMNT